MILGILLGAGLVFAAAQISWSAWNIWREAAESNAAFRRNFPGSCFVCGHHRHGISYGFVDPETPVPAHDCTGGQ